MALYFTSDLHLGHKSIIKYRPQFKTMEEHDEYILCMIEKLTKYDTLRILGDFLFECPNYKSYVERLNKASCTIQVLMGNHDTLELHNEPKFEMKLPLYTYKNMWLSHCPIHPQELRGRLGNVHGHLHGTIIDDPQYFNVNVDNNNFQFVHLDTIRDYFNTTQKEKE